MEFLPQEFVALARSFVERFDRVFAVAGLVEPAFADKRAAAEPAFVGTTIFVVVAAVVAGEQLVPELVGSSTGPIVVEAKLH